MGRIIYSKIPFMISVHTSGSTFSAAAVEPLTSQNNIVMIRRSPTIASFVRAASNFVNNSRGINLSKDWVFAACSLFPVFIPWIVSARDIPQFMQNFASLGLTVWQLGHFIRYKTYRLKRER